MKSSIYLFFACLLLTATGCPQKNTDKKFKAAAGLPPVAGLAAAIAGDRMEIITVLPEGKTPHDFTPRNETIRKTAGAQIFFTTGMPFENKIASFMKQRAKICDVTAGIERIAFQDGRNNDHHHHDGCSHDDHDPHVWLSPANAIRIAENICAEFVAADPDGKEYYEKNLAALKEKLSALDQQISRKLHPFAGRPFFVYHPAFGYFADAYNLKQRAIELNGREASAADLAQIIKEAKAANIHTVFVQEQFNPRNANALAKEINGVAVPLDPLASNLLQNFEKIADALASGFEGNKK
ncbi:MAG: hypothetical protein E7058_04980 [Lentisphaerae bacterium]|nr:hypothetical protein [Lentisphaerota bacterium]